jgi:arsenate reductase (thioredoxin)
MKKVLFVCVHNSARSQMAEALLKKYADDVFEVESAGFEPGVLNPLVIEVMQEEDIDISHNETDSVFEFFKQGKQFHYVITVCDEATSEKCPIFPGVGNRINWSFKDPSLFTGTYEEKLSQIRDIKDEIKMQVFDFIRTIKENENK